jgi:hypothetical protein
MTRRMTLPEANPELMESWNHDLNRGLDLDTLTVSSMDMAWWDCATHGTFQARVRNRARGTGCQKCAFEAMRQSKITPAPGNSLAEVAPDIAKTWHVELNGSLTPKDLAGGSKHVAWWSCPDHGPWRASLNSRTKSGAGCRKCSTAAIALIRATPPSGRSLADRCPDMAAQWHPTLNGLLTPKDVMPGSRKVVWWDCPEHGAWQQSLNVRYSQGCGCPPCGLAKAKAKFNETMAKKRVSEAV